MMPKQAPQTGMTVRCLDWLFACKNRLRNQTKTLIADAIYWRSRSTAPRHQVINLKEQSTQDQEPRWSEEWARLMINVWLISRSKLPRRCTRVCVFSLYTLIDSCVDFAKWIDLNHTHKEKVFGNSLDIVSRSGSEINGLAAPTWKHGSSSSHEIS